MPEREQPGTPDGELMGVLLDRLGPSPPEGSGTPLGRSELLRILRTPRPPWRRRGRQEMDPEIAQLFGLVATQPADLEQLTPEIAQLVQQGLNQGLSREELPHVFQAYVRAVGRVVAAETASVRAVLTKTPPDQRAETLADVLDLLLPIGAHGFDVMRRIMLLEALAEEVDAIDGERVNRETAVAMIDLVSSTAYLAQPSAQLEVLVDALFQASQAATLHHAVYVMKYVGDGVFLAGRDVEEVADVALDVIARLEASQPLRARGGLAVGPVVQRAGDLFGLPVNLALLVSKVARPGKLVATESAAAELPSARRGRYRTIDVMHPALRELRAATVRPAA